MTQPTPTPPAQPVIPEKLKEDLTKVLDVHCASAFSRDCAVENVLDAIQPYLAPDAQRVAELEKDKARLDWLALDPYARNQRVRWELPVAAFPNESGARDAYRAAIDAAMSRTTEAKP